MKKTKLEIIRINEDVIATSNAGNEFCTNHAAHYLVTGGPNGYYDATKYYFNGTDGKWHYQENDLLLQDNKTVGHYYVSGGVECTENHDTSNCVKDNK